MILFGRLACFHTKSSRSIKTSVVLNIAEGNGRYFDADRHKFIDLAEAAATKSAAYVDLCWRSSELAHDQRSQGITLLGSVVRILNALGDS